MTPLRVGIVILATAVSAVLVANFVLAGLIYVSPGGTPSAYCVSDSNCTLNVRHVDDTCAYRSLSRDVACQDACYIPDSTTTMCNGQGACVGQVHECRGTCASFDDDGGYCSAAIPLDIDYWFNHQALSYYHTGVPHEAIADYGFSCKFHQCGAYAIISQVAGGVLPSFVAAGGRWGNNPCLGYLNQTFMATHSGGRCIQAREFVLERPLSRNWTLARGDAQLSVCLYQYACSKLDYAMLMDDFNTGDGVTGSFSSSIGTLSITASGATVTATNLSAAASLQTQADAINAAQRAGQPRFWQRAPLPLDVTVPSN